MERGNSRSLPDCSRRRKHIVDTVEGICDLPDSIIGHILSFLPTKNAVATCILSQRWKFLWTMTINLDFRCCYQGVDRFVEFVNYVLLLHKPGYLNRFSLTWTTGCVPFYVNAWITTAIARNVHQLSVFFRLSKLSIHVQRSMFSCESLQSLELNGNICISNEIVVSLPKLESLKLISVFFDSEETLSKLLGGCPVLKYLFIDIDMLKTIEQCHLDNWTAFRCIISSTSLRRLELRGIDDEKRPFNMSSCGVQLDAPSLNYIKLDEISSISIRQSLVFLVEANVQLFQPTFADQSHYNSVVEAFRAFDCAKTLVLRHEVFTVFSSATTEMKTMFNKLTRLEVTKDWNYWSSLHKFIMMSDNLEVFIINKDSDCSSDYLESDVENLTALENRVPRCLSNSLRKVSIDGYDGNEDEFAMVSYILKHGSVLELMEIRLWSCIRLEMECELIQNICKLPRNSPVCEVEFCHELTDISKVL